MIIIKDLTLILPGGRKLFDNLTWQIDRGNRVGLVGVNGIGKTTLLKVISGKISKDSGSVEIVPSSLKIGYLPQDLEDIPSVRLLDLLKDRSGISWAEKRLLTCAENLASSTEEDHEKLLRQHDEAMAHFESLDGYSFEGIAKKTLRGLGFKPGDELRNCDEFSGGWKMRISLASILLARPEILLLDEPTNHLDTESMEWLENWLSSYDGTLVTISHDRVFMDKIMNSIAELSSYGLKIYKGNYSDYLRASEERKAQLEQSAIRQKEEIQKTKDFIERFRYKATKATQVQSRIKALEKMDVIHLEGPSKKVHIRFKDAPPSGRVVHRLSGVSKSYGDKLVFKDITAEIERGQKIALVGINGSGKTTLSNIISGYDQPTSGTSENGHNVSLAYFSQESSDNLNYSHTIWQEISPLAGHMSDTEKRTFLGSFLFSDDDIHKPINVLSGGEKSRLSLAKILLKPSNFLILDEPTNHLDIATRELFQEALLSYGGTLLIVSHDRFFLNELAGRILEIRDQRLYDYEGNYSSFIDQRNAQLERTKLASQGEPISKTYQPPNTTEKLSEKEQKRIEAEKRNNIYRQKKDFVKELKKLEEEIARKETQKTEIEKSLCEPETLSDSTKVQNLMKDLSELENQIHSILPRWEELMELIETIENQE